MIHRERRMHRLGKTGLTRRRVVAGGAAALAAAAAPGLGGVRAPSAAAQDNQVVTTGGGGAWEAALRSAYFDPFQEETGIEVVTVDYPTNAELQLKVETDTVDIDLVEFTGSALYTFVEDDLLEAIDRAVIGEEIMSNLLPEAMFDDYGISSHLGSVIYGYRTDVFADNAPTSWADFWDTEAFPGLRTLGEANGPTPCTVEIALLADGVAPEELYPLDLDRAFESLDRIRESVVTWWDTGTQAPQLLTDQQVDLASAYNGRIQDIIEQDVPVAITWNGGVLYAPPYVVPKGAPHRANAMQLLAFMLDPERQAEFSMQISYGPVNRLAYDFLPEERAAVLNTTPDRLEVQIPRDDRWWASEDESGRPMDEVVAERWLEWAAG